MLTRAKTPVLLSLLFVAVAVISCQDMGNEPEPGLSVVTDKSTYAIEEYILITVANSGDFEAHLPSCCASPAYHIDRYENGTWRVFSSPGLPCPPGVACPSKELVVTRTEKQHGTTFLSARGTFRIRVPYGGSNEKLTEEVLSNTFVVQ